MFATNLDDHNANVKRWRDLMAAANKANDSADPEATGSQDPAGDPKATEDKKQKKKNKN